MSASDESWPDVDRRHRARRVADDRRASDTPRAPDRRVAARRSGEDRRDELAWEPLEIQPAADEAAADALVTAAARARTHAHAQYSGFAVGSALETVDGQIVPGCNIENATYGLTLCAERVALVKALSEGRDAFTRIAVVADTATLTPPCGSCRQLLWEYCGDIEIVLANFDGARARYRLSALFPEPFDGRLL